MDGHVFTGTETLGGEFLAGVVPEHGFRVGKETHECCARETGGFLLEDFVEVGAVGSLVGCQEVGWDELGLRVCARRGVHGGLGVGGTAIVADEVADFGVAGDGRQGDVGCGARLPVSGCGVEFLEKY